MNLSRASVDFILMGVVEENWRYMLNILVSRSQTLFFAQGRYRFAPTERSGHARLAKSMALVPF